MSAAAASPLAKAAMGGIASGVGGSLLGGASDQGVSGFGTDPKDKIHPEQLLRRSQETISRLGPALTEMAGEKVDLGQQAIMQTPQFFHGGDLPMPIGLSGIDVGFQKMPKKKFRDPFFKELRNMPGAGGGGRPPLTDDPHLRTDTSPTGGGAHGMRGEFRGMFKGMTPDERQAARRAKMIELGLVQDKSARQTQRKMPGNSLARSAPGADFSSMVSSLNALNRRRD